MDLDRVDLTGNTTGSNPGNGGGLHTSGAGTVTVSSSTVRDNTAANEGGGLWYSAAGTMTVTRSRITGNAANGTAADSGGGGLFNQSAADNTGGEPVPVADTPAAAALIPSPDQRLDVHEVSLNCCTERSSASCARWCRETLRGEVRMGWRLWERVLPGVWSGGGRGSGRGRAASWLLAADGPS